MKNTIVSTFLIFLFIPLCSYAQTEIKGIVKDLTDIIAFASVYLNDANNQIVTGDITDDKGKFKLTAKRGIYKLIVSFTGYTEWSQEINLDKDIDLGIIVMTKEQNQLTEVVVTAKKPLIERKVDRLVFNVGNSIAGSFGSALEVLRVTPRITIEPNGNIQMIGKENVNILINGLPSYLKGRELQNFLSGLSSSEIERIEVITNPPAKYEAEGNSGLVNIVLKREKPNYFGGSITTAYEQRKYSESSTGGTLKYNKNRVSVSTSLNYKNGIIAPTENQVIYYNQYILDNKNRQKYFINSLYNRNSLDYKISDKLSLGAIYNFTSNKNNQFANGVSRYLNYTNNTPDSTILSKNKLFPEIDMHDAAIYSEFKLDSLGKKVELGITYLERDNKSHGSLTSNLHTDSEISTQKLKNLLNSKNQIKTVSADVDLPYKKFSLNFGTKMSFIKNYNNSKQFNFIGDTYIIDDNISNIFKYKESTQAIYISILKKWNKWESKAGLRYENTQTIGNSININQENKNNYAKLFPTFYINYRPNNNHTFSLTYSKRIGRPNYQWLNPFRYYYNANFYSVGNPFLKPSYTNNLSISHEYKSLYSELSVSNTIDDQRNFMLVSNDTNTQIAKPENFINRTSYSIYESFNFNKFRWWNLSIAIQGQYTIEKYNEESITQKRFDIYNVFFNLKNSIALNYDKTFNIEFNYWYKSKFISSSIIANNMQDLDIGVQYKISKNLSLSLYGSDLFATTGTIGKSILVNNIQTTFDNFYDTRKIECSLRYVFGKKIHNSNTYSKNREEKNRL